MHSLSDSNLPEVPAPARPQANGSGLRAMLGAAPAPPPAGTPTALTLAVGGVALALLHPLLYVGASVPAWTPAAGLGLALVAWWGTRAVMALALAAALVVARQALRGDSATLGWAAAEGVSLVAEPLLAWLLYRHLARGSRRLEGPRSAILYVFLVPGAAALAIAVTRLPPALLLAADGASAAWLLARLWLDHALALALVTPPLLVTLTDPLTRRGLARPEPRDPQSGERGAVAAARPGGGWGDWIETAGLALGAGALCLIISVLNARREMLGWQLWGVQVLLIVWAATRQGVRGGTLVAAASAAVPLAAMQLWPPAEAGWPSLLLQAHLLVQGCAALLVASASSLARLHEAGYRQVVAHIPVMIYSARFREGGEADVVLASAASARLLGKPPEEMLGDHARWLALVHPDDRELVRAALEQLRRQSVPVTCEYRVGDGIVRWLRDTLAPHRDAEGELIGWEGVVSDITEQRVLADDLRRTTGMFHALLSNLPAGVFFVQGPHGTPALVNARARQLLGQREDASTGLDQLVKTYRLHRADGTPYPAEDLPVYQALRHGRTTMRDDIVVQRPDGRRVPLVTWAAPVRMAGRGAPDAAVWVLEDLTAVHQAEAARIDTEGRLHATIEAMAEGLLLHDAKGGIMSCNPAASAFFGVSADKMRGKIVHELGWDFRREDGSAVSPEDLPSRVALRTGHPVRNVVMGAVPADATPSTDSGRIPASMVRWVVVNAVPLMGPKGPSGVVTTFADISATIHARDAIRASEERFRGLVESLPLMVILVNRDLRVTYFNPATLAITGYSLAEVSEPSAWLAVLHADDHARVLEMYRSAWAGQADRCELRYRAKDGVEKSGLMLIQPRLQDEAVIGALVIILDTTRERQLERDLLRAQRLDLIGRLASGIVHDFNNQLGVMLNLTDLALGQVAPAHPAHADLVRIADAGEQAAGLASQLLAFSRNRVSAPRRVAVNDVARRTLELLRASLPPEVRVAADLAEAGPTISGDETQLQQVLMNLCLNARDAMPEGGELRVRTALDRGTVVLEVSDTGQGMPQAVLTRVFEPFFSTKETGTGLGLAVVHQIVESSHGTIRVESEPGKGSRFIIRWPACEG